MKPSGHEKVLEIIKSTRDMPEAEAVLALVDCAKKGFPLAAEKAVKTMAGLGYNSTTPALVGLYEWLDADPRKRDNGCDVRISIAEAFVENPSPLAVGIMRKAVCTVHVVRVGLGPEDVAIPLRAAAVLALAAVDPDCLYQLAMLLFDKAPDVPTSDPAYAKAAVRKAAAKALSVLGDPGGLPLLAVKLNFPAGEVPDVLAECLEAFIFMRPAYLMEVVQPYLEGDDDFLCAITALSLAETFGPKMLPLLQSTLDRVQSEAKEAITVAISATRCDAARQLLLELLESNNPFLRRGAVKGLKTYLDDEIMARLDKIQATDPDKYIRLEAEY
ncbi:MAG: hypothetical protein FWC78_05080 [Defluviitaleaceae bacterium]|nr:hypothetical protein [Defluviitaleaceae bacterium]